MLGDGALEQLKREGRIVVVGASLAGLRAAETLRAKGFAGSLTMIGDEPYEPYDRPPLSKGVLLGRARADRTALPRRRPSTRPGGSAFPPPAWTWPRGRCGWPTATRCRTTGC
ncbi:3-phenylpropionate/cinnamic acid dioxygenase ferredoxin--NAD(+) reductase component [Streptomyces tanashiensis]